MAAAPRLHVRHVSLRVNALVSKKSTDDMSKMWLKKERRRHSFHCKDKRAEQMQGVRRKECPDVRAYLRVGYRPGCIKFKCCPGNPLSCVTELTYHRFIRYQAVTGYLAALSYLQSKQCLIGVTAPLGPLGTIDIDSQVRKFIRCIVEVHASSRVV